MLPSRNIGKTFDLVPGPGPKSVATLNVNVALMKNSTFTTHNLIKHKPSKTGHSSRTVLQKGVVNILKSRIMKTKYVEGFIFIKKQVIGL